MKKFFTQTILLLVVLLAGTSAKAVSYKIDGPSILTTHAVYRITTTDGSALPAGLTASWSYPSDFYRISENSTTIELGRKMAIGTYTLSARLSNGSYVSKTIEAKEPDPTPVIPTPNPDSIKATKIHLEPVEVSRLYNGPYEDIMQYRPYTGKYYYMGYENLNVKFTLRNKTNESLTFTSNLFGIDYGNNNSIVPQIYKVLNITDESYNQLFSITIPANTTIKVIFHLGNEWYENRQNANQPDNVFKPVSLKPHYNGFQTDYMSYSYLFSRAALNSLSVSPTSVTSDVTIKTTDDSSIKSIKVVSTMGNLVKAKSYNGNCKEVNFDLSNCQKGIYYIQVEKTNGIETAKIIKK